MKSIQSIERAAAILRLLSGPSRRMGVVEIAGELGLAKATAHGILRTLAQVGFVEQDPESSKYQLGAALSHIGSSYLDGNELRTRALNWSDSLASRTNEASGSGRCTIVRCWSCITFFGLMTRGRCWRSGRCCRRMPQRWGRCCWRTTATRRRSASRRGCCAIRPGRSLTRRSLVASSSRSGSGVGRRSLRSWSATRRRMRRRSRIAGVRRSGRSGSGGPPSGCA